MSSPLHAWPWAPELAEGSFRFVPAITHAGPNEWTLRDLTWEAVLVENVVTQLEITVPRRYLGDVTRLEDRVRCVRLLKPLEFSDGVARPVDRGVLRMPVPADTPREAHAPAEVIAIRELPSTPPRWRKFLRIAMALGCLFGILAIYVLKQGRVRRFSGRPSRLVPHQPGSALPAQPQKR
jgi:hypothetical protein